MGAFELIRLLCAAPLLAWLPGAMAWRALAGRVHLHRAERIFVEIFASLVITTFIATALAELGIFFLPALLTGLILTSLLLLWRKGIGEWRMENGDWRPVLNPAEGLAIVSNLKSQISNLKSLSPSWTAGLLAVLLLAAVLFFRPAEAVLVMDDAGVYVIHGLSLARSGELAIRDPLLPSLTLEQAAQLLPFVRYDSSFIRHDGAFHIWHWGRGLVQPSFFHLPSIWMAVLALAAGPRAVIWATPLAGLLAVASLGLLAGRLFGRGVGFAASLLLTLSFPQVWYARYPMSEMFMQAWLLSGLFLLAVFLQKRSSFVGAVAGVGLGQLFLVRVDAWIAPVVIALCFVGWALTERHETRLLRRLIDDGWFLVPLGLALAWAGLHSALFASAYVVSIMHLHLSPHLAAVAMSGISVIVAAAVVAWYRPQVLHLIRWNASRAVQLASDVLSGWHRRTQSSSVPTAMWAIALLIAGGAIWVADTQLSGDLLTLHWLSWYFTPVGLAAALVGFVLMFRQGLGRPAQVFWVVAFCYALLYLPNPRTSHPVQPWGVRRLVPVVLPALTLAMAYLSARFPVPASWQVQQIVRPGLVLILVLSLTRNLRPVLVHHEYAGAWDQIEALASQLEPGSVVLFNKTGVGQAISQPLTYLYDRPAFVLQSERPDARVIEELADEWSMDGRPVYLALTGLAPWLKDLAMEPEPAGDFRLRFPRLERIDTHAPRIIEAEDWRIDLYRLTPGAQREAVSRLEMGPGELAFVLAGFYDREVAPDGSTFRWTDGAAHISLPLVRDVTSLSMRVSGPPASVSRPDLILFIDGREVGAWEMPDGFITLSAGVPAGAATDRRLDILLRSDTWTPAKAGLGDDDRRLGVVVDWIAVSVNSE